MGSIGIFWVLNLISVHCQGDLYILIRHFQTQGHDPNLGCGSFLMAHELPE